MNVMFRTLLPLLVVAACTSEKLPEPSDPSGPSENPICVFADKGAWSVDAVGMFKVPENSLGGILRAAQLGYDGVECDVRCTSDGVMVLNHDETINRTMRNASDYSSLNEDVYISQTSLDELRNNYVFASVIPSYRTKIPTLEEYLYECKRLNVVPMLHSDIQASYAMAKRIMGDDWVCLSGDLESCKSAREISDCLILYSTVDENTDELLGKLEEIGGACGVSLTEPGICTPEYVSALTSAGYLVQVSSFSEADEGDAIKNGVSYIKTDNIYSQNDETVSGSGSQDFVTVTGPKLKVGVMGDSISTMLGELVSGEYEVYYPFYDPNWKIEGKDAVDSKEETWWGRIIYGLMENAQLDVNSSWSGSKVVHQIVTIANGAEIEAGFVNRIDDSVDPDIIMIHGGTNDRAKKVPLGDYGWNLSLESLDLNSFKSAYVYLVRKLQLMYPDVRLILIIGDTLTEDYANSIIDIARHYDLKFVNLIGVPVDKCSGCHPSVLGHKQMADKIYEECKDILK